MFPDFFEERGFLLWLSFIISSFGGTSSLGPGCFSVALEFSFDGGGIDGGHGFGGFEGMCFGLLCDDFRFFFAEEFSLVKGFDVLFEYFSFLIGVIL